MRSFSLLCLAVFALGVRADDAGSRPPLTIDERIEACSAAEDAEQERALALANSVLAESSVSVLQRGKAIGCRGWAHAGLQQVDDARRDSAELQTIVGSLPVGPERMSLHRRAGAILHRSGDRVGAIALYGEALREAEKAGLEADRIPLLINLGVHHSEFEENELARVNYEQALALMDVIGDHRWEAPVRFNLGLTLNGSKKYKEAVPHLERALELVLASGMGGPAQQLSVQLALATALHDSGERARAAALVGAVRDDPLFAEDVSMRTMLAHIDADTALERGDPAAAVRILSAIPEEGVPDLQYQKLLQHLSNAQQAAGLSSAAFETSKRVLQLRESFLKSQNHERVAGLEAHLRDREQRSELARLQQVGEHQAIELAQTRKLALQSVLGAGALITLGIGVLVWQRRMNRRLDVVSRTDVLTGLPNRRDMTERLRARAERQGESPAVLFVIDIDHFKQVNDRYGHDTGDRVLRELANRLASEAKGADEAVARWGGEEFLLIANASSFEAACAHAERLLRRLTSSPAPTPPTRLGQPLPSITVSIGFAPLPLPGAVGLEAWQDSIKLADAALYVAKSAGRDGWSGYWVLHNQDGWTSDRIAREPRLAHTRGALERRSSRKAPEPLHAIA